MWKEERKHKVQCQQLTLITLELFTQYTFTDKVKQFSHMVHWVQFCKLHWNSHQLFIIVGKIYQTISLHLDNWSFWPQTKTIVKNHLCERQYVMEACVHIRSLHYTKWMKALLYATYLHTLTHTNVILTLTTGCKETRAHYVLFNLNLHVSVYS